MLEKAIIIAAKAHMGQLDKGHNPYILHPLRVMLSCENETEKICAVLHDVVEDTEVTFKYLRKRGFSEEVIEILDCLTKRKGEEYDDFIGRILTNKTACRVKLEDITDNMDISRINNPTEKDKKRLEKYKKAAERIKSVLFKY